MQLDFVEKFVAVPVLNLRKQTDSHGEAGVWIVWQNIESFITFVCCCLLTMYKLLQT